MVVVVGGREGGTTQLPCPVLSWEPGGQDAGAPPHRYQIQQVIQYSRAGLQNCLAARLGAEMWRRHKVTVAKKNANR